ITQQTVRMKNLAINNRRRLLFNVAYQLPLKNSLDVVRYTVTDSVEHRLQSFAQSRSTHRFRFHVLEQVTNLEMQDLKDGKVLHQRVQFMQIGPNQIEPDKDSQNSVEDGLGQLQHHRIVDAIQRRLNFSFHPIFELVTGSPDGRSLIALLH